MTRILPYIVVSAALATGCDRSAKEAPGPAVSASAVNGCPAVGQAVLTGTLYGALQHELAVAPAAAACQGMPRPAQRGVRLQFRVTPAIDRGPLVFIIGIDNVDRDDTGTSIRSTVTIIDEDANRFFSTGDQPSCFSDIQRNRYRAAESASDIEGVLWCTAAIPEVNGEQSVRVTELRFAGRVTWPAGS